MSLNRLTYDACAYNQALTQSVAPLSYVMDNSRYVHCNRCRMELGIVGGTAVSHISGNMVDLENDLRGQTRQNSHCTGYKYVPTQNSFIQSKAAMKVNPKTDTTLKHLPPCQMINYGAVPLAPPMSVSRCSI
jgi:hypothetical protein